MKLSSVSLAIVATIVGSATAAPVALHACDLEEINPIGRDIDVYSRAGVAVLERDVDSEPADDLFTRQPLEQHQNDHDEAAHACLDAAKACNEAAKDSVQASYNQLSSPERRYWRSQAQDQALVARLLLRKAMDHHRAKYTQEITPLHSKVVVDTMAANLWKSHAEQQSREAVVAYHHPK